MSIWGPKPWENDAAADFIGELAEAPKLGPITKAFARATRKGTISDDDGCEAIAAADALAQAAGVPGKKAILKKETATALTRALKAGKAAHAARLFVQGATAIKRVLTGPRSELKDIWDDEKNGRAWVSAGTELARRLARAPAALKKLPLPAAPKKKKKKAGVPLGAIFAIPVKKMAYAYDGKKGTGYAYARLYRDDCWGIYDCFSKKVLSVDEIVGKKIAFFVVAIEQSPRAGKWKRIGDQPFASEDDAWGPPMVWGNTIAEIETHLHIVDKGVERPAPWEEAVGLATLGICNHRDVLRKICRRLLNGEHDDDVVLSKEDLKRFMAQ